MELKLHNPHRNIILMLDPLTNHLSLQDLTHKLIIILMKTIYLISLLIAWMIMIMILCIIAIQCKNDYIMQVFMNVFVKFTILCMYFGMFLPTMRVIMISLYV